MRNLIPSPLRSAWTFIGYLLIFIVPVWKLVSFLGDVGFVMGYAAPVGNFFATGWGIALLIAVGFGCLVYANYRQRSSEFAAPTPPKSQSVAKHAPSPQIDREELKRLKSKLTEAERKNASDQAVIEKQQEQLDRFDGDRQRFKELLTEALLEGRRLRENEPSDDEVQEWKAHMRDLLVAALGEGSRVDGVMKDDPSFESAVHGSTSEQKQIERSTNRLHDLIEWVKSPQTIPFRSGFDPHKWEDWKSPPPTTEQVRIEQLQAALQKATWERDSLFGRVRELEMMSPEEYRARQEERRKRIEKWRAEIDSHTFARHPLGGSLFAQTETYSDMRPLLPPNVQQRYESHFFVGAFLGSPRKIGKDGDRRVLLDEVSRIEKQWGVV